VEEKNCKNSIKPRNKEKSREKQETLTVILTVIVISLFFFVPD
jgi:hypothetical protein